MSDAEYDQTYLDCWRAYYTPEHIETVARRHGSIKGRNPGRARPVHDHVQDHVRGRGHPSAGRRHRAPEVPARPPLRHADRAVGVFHWKLAVETVKKLKIYGRLPGRAGASASGSRIDSKRLEYTDLALQPVVDDDMEKLSMFTDTAGGGGAVNKVRGEELARAKVAAAQNQRLAAARVNPALLNSFPPSLARGEDSASYAPLPDRPSSGPSSTSTTHTCTEGGPGRRVPAKFTVSRRRVWWPTRRIWVFLFEKVFE
jgi:hypothetical protein